MDDLKFPIGKYKPVEFSEQERVERINHIEALPRLLEASIEGLTNEDLQQPYREGGWTIHQLVHHVADSHMNAFVRMKLAMEGTTPTIAPYDQDVWVTLPDVINVPVNHSITLLHSLHTRWAELLKGIQGEQWERAVYHPETKRNMSMWFLLGTYAWHGRHHAQHILAWRERQQ